MASDVVLEVTADSAVLDCVVLIRIIKFLEIVLVRILLKLIDQLLTDEF